MYVCNKIEIVQLLPLKFEDYYNCELHIYLINHNNIRCGITVACMAPVSMLTFHTMGNLLVK